MNMIEEKTTNPSPAEVCKQTRGLASTALLAAIKPIRERSFSEVDLRNLWLKELRKNPGLFPNGWYSPPPNGIGILIAGEQNPARLNYDSLRPEESWPKQSIVFDPQTGLAYVYASPVNKASGIIGDFGMTLYAGVNPEIISHLKKVYDINHQIVQTIKPGQKVSTAYNQAVAVFEQTGLSNQIISTTDPLGINIGHSVPGTLSNFSSTELAIIQGNNREEAHKVISHKRVFFNGGVNHVFKPGNCFTIEPRLIDPQKPELPMVSFHTIFQVTDSGAELWENFEEIFSATGMNYMR